MFPIGFLPVHAGQEFDVAGSSVAGFEQKLDGRERGKDLAGTGVDQGGADESVGALDELLEGGAKKPRPTIQETLRLKDPLLRAHGYE